MEPRDQINYIHSALNMREEVWNEEKQSLDSKLSITGEEREKLKSRLVELLLSLNPKSKEDK